MITIQEIEQSFKDVFQEEEGRVSSVDTIYEKDDKSKDLKLIISIHGLSVEDTLIIHTKFIFRTDPNKRHIEDNSFLYLYDINCKYKKVKFDNIIDMKNKIEDIIESNDFGKDIVVLSDFIEAPAMFLNFYLKRAKITNYSIFDVKYEPKFKIQPCDKTTFDFQINVNNNYNIDLSISKRDKIEKDDYDVYKFQFKFLNEYKTVESTSIENIHYFIGSNIAKLLDAKLQ